MESTDAFERLPLILLEGPTADEYVESGKYLDTLQQRWAAFEDMPFHGFLETSDFDGLSFRKRNVDRPTEHNERRLVRHEVWRHQYRQNPYLRELSESKFLDHAERVIVTMAPHFLKDGHKFPEDAIRTLMVGWTHVLEEAEFRRMDMRKLQQRLPDFSKLTGRAG